MNTLTASEIKYAFRMLRKSPGLSLLAVISLAFGLGLTTAAFSVVHAVFLSDLPFPEADRIVAVFDYHRAGRYNVYTSGQEFERRAAQLQSFESTAAYHVRNVLVGDQSTGSVARAAFITTRAFEVLGVRPLMGRGPVDDDGRPGVPGVVILSNQLWRARFGGDKSALGRTVKIAGEERTIAGIMPDGFRFPENEDLWIPISATASDQAAGERLKVFGKLRRGVSIAEAEAELTVIAGQHVSARYKPGELVQFVRPYTRGFDGDEEHYFFYGAIVALILLLLVAAANVANLLLARNAARVRELAVRAALGASRARLMAHLLLEAFILCGVAAALGYGFASAGLSWLATFGEFPFWVRFGPNPAVLGFVGLLVSLATAAAGIAPALKTTRVSVIDVLKQGSNASPGLQFGRLSAALIVAEFAIAVGFIGTAGTLGRGMLVLGYEHELPAGEILISQIYYGQPPKLDGVNDPQRRREIWREFISESGERSRRIEEKLRAVPGVRDVTFAGYFPGSDLELEPVHIDTSAGAIDTSTILMSAGPSYFEILDARLVAGRMFTPDEYTEPARVALVNESFARRHFAGRNPLGATIRLAPQSAGQPERRVEIVGVTPDLALNPADPSRVDGIYLPAMPGTVVRAAVRAAGEPRAMIPAIHEVVQQEAPAAQVQWSVTLKENIEQTVNVFRGMGGALLALGGIAMLLSAASMYAIVAFSVTQRTREIGIRVALGAERRHVLHALLRRQVAQLLCGAAAGALLSVGIFQLVRQLPFPMEGSGVAASAAFPAALFAVGLGACLMPARRALRIQPMEALRHE